LFHKLPKGLLIVIALLGLAAGAAGEIAEWSHPSLIQHHPFTLNILSSLFGFCVFSLAVGFWLNSWAEQRQRIEQESQRAQADRQSAALRADRAQTPQHAIGQIRRSLLEFRKQPPRDYKKWVRGLETQYVTEIKPFLRQYLGETDASDVFELALKRACEVGNSLAGRDHLWNLEMALNQLERIVR
jgi:hypothetical protein